MKQFMITALCLLACIFPPRALRAQKLQILVGGNSNPLVSIENIQVDVKVTGNIAATTWTMVFRNSANRLLEGELCFPLAEGITVSRYAIDINGKLREAVPVEKAKATTVLEAIEQRRVDPGLLERVEGNAFKTRIYPLPANGTRTVVIGYEELLQTGKGHLEYRLPMQLNQAVPSLTITASVIRGDRPFTDSRDGLDLSFDQEGYTWNARKVMSNYKSDRPLVFRIPQPETPRAFMQQEGNHYYFLVNAPARNASRTRQLTDEPTILWDASLSGLKRDHQAELALLDGYFRKVKDATVRLVVFSNAIQSAKSYVITDGGWAELKYQLQHIVYDGGTQLGILNLSRLPGKEFLVFSDGLGTYGKGEFTEANRPVHCINAALHADWGKLRSVSSRTGGELIDLTTTSPGDALNQLTRQQLKLLGIKAQRDVEDVYPSTARSAANGNTISGICYNHTDSVTLQWGYGNEVTAQETVVLNASESDVAGVNLGRIWATQKIAELDNNYEQNKIAIEALGHRFGLVTRNTSLIVLETLDDYLRYNIEPPEELREAYDRVIKTRGEQMAAAVQNRMNIAEQTFNDLLRWWEKNSGIKSPVRKNGDDEVQFTGASQSAIKGILTDEKGDPIVNANVILKQDGIETQRTTTDFDGNYRLQNLRNGHYDISFNYLGRSLQISDVVLASGVIKTVNGRLSAAHALKGAVVRTVRTYAAPVIDPENPGGRSVKTAEQIERAPTRNVADLASLSTQVYQGSGQDLSIGGGRASKTRYIVDGVQLPPGATGFVNEAPTGVIKAASYAFDDKLLGGLRGLPEGDQYQYYLKLREQHMELPVFYFQAACHFLSTDRKSVGLKILSNLAELDLENYELYKMLGYKLRETGEADAAVEAFRKVLAWRPMDPQSRRDFALALADVGQYSAAVDTLFAALTGDIDPSLQNANSGIEETILCDINGILALHPTSASAAVPRKLVQATPTDIRVVMNWNTKSTDIDLWVRDPSGEKCYYGHKETAMGGRISKDVTQGFGPEQFLLRNAGAGKYRIEVNYYGESQVKIAGPATVMAEVYTGWCTRAQKRQIITLQLKPGDNGGVYVGEFVFDNQFN